MTAISVQSLSVSSIAAALNVSRNRVTAARDKREAFDLLIDEQTLDITENNKKNSSETGISSDYYRSIQCVLQ